MNVTVHAAETSRETLLHDHLPLLLRTAGDISADTYVARSEGYPLLDEAGSAALPPKVATSL